MSRFFVILLTATVSLFFNACQKEPDPSIIQEPVYNCQLKTGYYYDQNILVDSVVHLYSGTTLTRSDMIEYYFTYEYNNGNLVRRNRFTKPSNAPDGYEVFYYNTDKTISKIEWFFYTTSTTPDYIDEYTYTSGKLVSVHSKVKNFTGTIVTDTKGTFSYTGNNITSFYSETYDHDTFELLQRDTAIYTYDANPNYFKKQSSYTLFADILFEEAIAGLLPFILSENNLKTFSINGQLSDFDYVLDEKKNLKDFRGSTELISSYRYNCN